MGSCKQDTNMPQAESIVLSRPTWSDKFNMCVKKEGEKCIHKTNTYLQLGGQKCQTGPDMMSVFVQIPSLRKWTNHIA